MKKNSRKTMDVNDFENRNVKTMQDGLEDEISQETKSDIQELFDELFFEKINEDISRVQNEICCSTEILKENGSNERDHYVSLKDDVEKVLEFLGCLGDEDDWCDENLLEKVNSIIKRLNINEERILKKIEVVNQECNNEFLVQYLNDIIEKMDELSALIYKNDDDSKEQLKFYFERVQNEIVQLKTELACMQHIETVLADIDEKVATGIQIRSVIENSKTTNECLLKIEDDIVKIQMWQDKVDMLNTRLERIPQIIEDERKNAVCEIQKIFDSGEENVIKEIEQSTCDGKEEVIEAINRSLISAKDSVLKFTSESLQHSEEDFVVKVKEMIFDSQNEINCQMVEMIKQGKRKLLFAYCMLGGLGILDIIIMVLLIVK